MKLTQFEQLPLSHGYIVLDGCPPSAPYRSLTITWYCAWLAPWVRRFPCAITELTSACVPEPNWYPSPIQPPETCPPPRNAVMPSGPRNWSAGWVPSWLTPYRNPSPTARAAPRVEARLTLSDSVAAAWPDVAVSSGIAIARAAPATIARRPRLVVVLIDSS